MVTPAGPGYRRRVHTSPPVPPGGPDAGARAGSRIEATGSRIEVTEGWLTRAGRPWFPVTGEVHYSRLARERWSEVLGHARAGGLTSVACYVFWQAHEPDPGQFRWDGNRDLRAFVQEADRHGLEVIVRLGPWAHGEARYGGFPDWLVRRGITTRRNEEPYLGLVRRLYTQIATQLSGLAHAEGGPVIGAQVENELYDQPEHLARLRTIAEEAGLHLPVWTATAWGGAQVPPSLLGVYSGYADGFWADDEDWPEFAATHFDYQEVRDDLTVGADLREAFEAAGAGTGAATEGSGAPNPAHGTCGAGPLSQPPTPYVTCELGGGMHVAYHRRPLVTARDVAALAKATIGSGSVWQGYYMYAGGTQRTGANGTEQESHATGYPNDVPTRSYDFHAPVGEHGQVREHHHLLRRQHLWLATDGEALAAMTSQTTPPTGAADRLRWAVRSDGDRGYLFLTTYQPARRPLPAQPGVQLSVDLAEGGLTVPHSPVDLPAGISVVWPVRYPLTEDLVLRSATAELLTRIAGDAGRELVVLVATDTVAVELVLEHRGGGAVPVSGAGVGTMVDGATRVALSGPPSPSAVVRLPGVDLLVLDEASANRLYRLPLAGRDRLVLSDAPLYTDDGALVLHPQQEHSRLRLLPAPAALAAAAAPAAPRPGSAVPDHGQASQHPARSARPEAHPVEDDPAGDTAWRSWTVLAPTAGAFPVGARILAHHAPLADLPPVARGGPLDRLSAPQDFSMATRVQLDPPGELLDAVDRVLLRVTWTGDVGRALVAGEVISDHFWHGRVWDVDLTPWREQVRTSGVLLELLPWRPDAGVWVDPSLRPVPAGVSLTSVEVVRVPQVVLRAER